MISQLNEKTIAEAAERLAGQDVDLAAIYQRYGPPPLWARPPGFASMVRIILEQQVSLASALAAFNRLNQVLLPLTPESFLTLDDQQLKIIGFSRQKTRYCRLLAQAVLEGQIDLEKLSELEDDQVRLQLIRLKGVGDWSADIYLLMALRRPDVWPKRDLALINTLVKVKKLPSFPDEQQVEGIVKDWAPYRAVAARMLWFEYLGGRP
jgi:DNA-3-methyladenine glycosylase II